MVPSSDQNDGYCICAPLCAALQVDSPAQLAIELVNTTSNFEGIQSAADLSLVLGLLTSVTDSPDLQQEEVSGYGKT